MPSVIGSPGGCLGAISIRWRYRCWVQVRWRTFFDFSRLAQCSHLCARGIVLVLIGNSIHKRTVSGLPGAGHQLSQLLLPVGNFCKGFGDGRAVQKVISAGFRVGRKDVVIYRGCTASRDCGSTNGREPSGLLGFGRHLATITERAARSRPPRKPKVSLLVSELARVVSSLLSRPWLGRAGANHTLARPV
jgi:hypothetical protein